MNFKKFALVLLTPWLFVGTAASAADYPTQPLNIVVPWPAGGLVDFPARAIAEKLQASLGVPVVVRNKPGAGGIIGASEVARAAPDGYTIMLTTSALNMNDAIRSDMPFDVKKDFEPVGVAAYTSLILVTGQNGPDTVAELIAEASKSPGKLSYASAGAGTPGNFAGEMLKTAKDLEIVHVPYKGGPPAMMDQIAGLIDFHFANAAVALPQLEANKIKALGVASMKRMPQLPEVPTLVEQGVADFDLDQWIGFLAPAGTPTAIVERLSQEIGNALQDPALQDSLQRNGMTAAQAQTPGAFKDYLRKDLEKWTTVAETSAIKLD